MISHMRVLLLGGMIVRFVKSFLTVLSVLMLTVMSVCAADPSYGNGEVLYHQDFGVVWKTAATEIQRGTSSHRNAVFYLADGHFVLDTQTSGRLYAILPTTPRTKTFTVELSFSFDKISADNGYLGIMLTSSGKEPGNISQVVIRAKGAVDDFEAMSEAMAERIRAGETVDVKIPVKNGVVQKLILTSGDITEELQRDSLLVLGSGNCGFSARNAVVNIKEVFIVNGVDYKEKTGKWAEASFAEMSETPDDPDSPEPDVETAPDTSDNHMIPALVVAVCSILGAKYVAYAEK